MSITEILFLAVSLSMDAFSVSVCKGLSMKKRSIKNELLVGAYFGLFQALMPLIGYFLGSRFESVIAPVDHWIAFVLLAFIGGKMIKESFDKDIEANDDLKFKTMIVLSVATSIDALASGIVLSIELDRASEVFFSVAIIGAVTFILSAAGVRVGNIFGAKYKSKAELAGGVILILLGLKILLTDLGILHI